jgi:hypothetical protein
VLSRVLDVNLLHNSPKEADEFTSSRNHGELRWLSGVDAVEELEESVLGLPGMSDDVGWLALLAFLELSRDGRSISVLPRGLNEDVATATVAGLGDVAPANAIPARVLGRDKSEESHELGGPLKASPVTDLGDEGHGGQRTDVPETGQPLDKGPISGGEGDGLDLLIEVVASAGLVVEEREVLGKDGAILWSEGTRFQETLHPFSVNLAPVARLAKHKPTPAQELQDVVAGAEDLALEALAATHEVPDPLLGRRWDTNGGEFTDSVEPTQLSGIVAVVLAAFAGPGRNERGGDHVTVDAPGSDFPVEHIAGTAGFVTGTNLPPSGPTIEEAAEPTEVVGKHLDELRLRSVIDENGDHDGILVDIHPNVNDGARHGAGPPIGCDGERRMWHWRETGLGPR